MLHALTQPTDKEPFTYRDLARALDCEVDGDAQEGIRKAIVRSGFRRQDMA